MKKKMKKICSLLAITVLLISSMPIKGQGVVSKEIEAGTDLKVNAKKVITAQNLTYQGNQSISKDNFVAAESAYRKAIGTNPADATPAFNLGSSFYNNQSYKEALSPLKKAASIAQTQEEKHAVFHNIGNVFMKNKEYEKAVAAYKEALRNNPIDNQTRYNLAIAKEMLKKDQQDKDKDKEKQEKKEPEDSKDQEKKDNKDKEGDQKKDKEGDPDKGDGDQKDKDGEPKDPSEKEEQKKGEGDQKKETPQKPKEDLSQAPPERKSQLSPQQVENLLEAMQNAEKKSQEKLEAKKVKGVPVKTKKDW
jgi:Ca-activated chloride channel family protein